MGRKGNIDKSHLVVHGVQYESISEIGRAFNLDPHTLVNRYHRGNHGDDLVEVKVAKKIIYEGKMLTLREIEILTGIPYATLRQRLKKGKTAESGLFDKNQKMAPQKKRPQPIRVKSKIGDFKNQTEFGQALDRSNVWVSNNRKKGLTWDEIIDLAAKPKQQQDNTGFAEKIEISIQKMLTSIFSSENIAYEAGVSLEIVNGLREDKIELDDLPWRDVRALFKHSKEKRFSLYAQKAD